MRRGLSTERAFNTVLWSINNRLQIIEALNNKPMPSKVKNYEVPGVAENSDGPLLQVKFADSGKKPRRQQINQSLEVRSLSSLVIGDLAIEYIFSLISPTCPNTWTACSRAHRRAARCWQLIMRSSRWLCSIRCRRRLWRRRSRLVLIFIALATTVLTMIYFQMQDFRTAPVIYQNAPHQYVPIAGTVVTQAQYTPHYQQGTTAYAAMPPG